MTGDFVLVARARLDADSGPTIVGNATAPGDVSGLRLVAAARKLGRERARAVGVSDVKVLAMHDEWPKSASFRFSFDRKGARR